MRFFGALVQLFGILCLGVAVFAGWTVYDQDKRTREFCAELKPGMPVSALAEKGKARGVKEQSLQGAEWGRKDDWLVFVPLLSALGEKGCRVRHDGKTLSFVTLDP